MLFSHHLLWKLRCLCLMNDWTFILTARGKYWTCYLLYCITVTIFSFVIILQIWAFSKLAGIEIFWGGYYCCDWLAKWIFVTWICNNDRNWHCILAAIVFRVRFLLLCASAEALSALRLVEERFVSISKSRIRLLKLQLLHDHALHRYEALCSS